MNGPLPATLDPLAIAAECINRRVTNIHLSESLDHFDRIMKHPIEVVVRELCSTAVKAYSDLKAHRVPVLTIMQSILELFIEVMPDPPEHTIRLWQCVAEIMHPEGMGPHLQEFANNPKVNVVVQVERGMNENVAVVDLRRLRRAASDPAMN